MSSFEEYMHQVPLFGEIPNPETLITRAFSQKDPHEIIRFLTKYKHDWNNLDATIKIILEDYGLCSEMIGTNAAEALILLEPYFSSYLAQEILCNADPDGLRVLLRGINPSDLGMVIRHFETDEAYQPSLVFLQEYIRSYKQANIAPSRIVCE